MTAINANGFFKLPSTAVPLALTPVANYDCTIDSLWVSNVTGAPISLSVFDGEGNPILSGCAIVQGLRIPVVSDDCPVLAKGGFSISAAVDGLYFGAEWRAV